MLCGHDEGKLVSFEHSINITKVQDVSIFFSCNYSWRRSMDQNALYPSEVNAVLKAHWFTPFIGFWFPWCWVSPSAWPCASVGILWGCVQTHASLQSRRAKIFTYAYSYNQMIMSICSSLYEHFPTVIVWLHEQVHDPLDDLHTAFFPNGPVQCLQENIRWCPP